MKACSRRWAIGALLYLGGGPSLTLTTSAALANANAPIPSGPMRLTRKLDRSLRDGNVLSVSRTWRVEFSRQGQGISISGEQISASVEAPSALASLAQIEQTRSTDEMWPILLSEDGRILASGRAAAQEDVAQAIDAAERYIAEQPIPESQQASQSAYLMEFQNRGATLLNRLPEDLFYPIGVPQFSKRAIELPQGLAGEFEVSYEAERAQGKLWLKRAVRKVITRVGESERRAVEEWVLSPFE